MSENGTKARILAVEDEGDLLLAIRTALAKEEYKVVGVRSAEAALTAAPRLRPDLFLLDISLPGMDGLSCYEELRRHSRAPAIFLTGRVEEETLVKGFQLGAEDYIRKPFSLAELAARVAAVLRGVRARRSHGPNGAAATSLRVGTLELDLERRELRVAGEAVGLTPKEFDFLRRLIATDGKVLSRDALLHDVWGVPEGAGLETRTVDQHVARLRRKLGREGGRIVTVTGLGYRLKQS